MLADAGGKGKPEPGCEALYGTSGKGRDKAIHSPTSALFVLASHVVAVPQLISQRAGRELRKELRKELPNANYCPESYRKLTF